jgi:pyrroline-5-carboxylate reductase
MVLWLALTWAAAISSQTQPRLGFIGVGTIASAMVRGLCTDMDTPPTIVLSPRGACCAALLAGQFPHCVSVAQNNQAVVDGCDVLFLCVLPQDASDVLDPLTLRADHVLVSVLSTATAASLASASRLPASRVVRAIPLPAVGERRGVTPVWPTTDECVMRVFDTLGGALGASSEAELMTLASMTSMIGQLYAQMGAAQDWLVRHGIAREQARRYVTAVYAGAVSNADAAAARRAAARAGDGAGVGQGGTEGYADSDNSADSESVFQALVREQTVGGINEQLLADMRDAGALEALRAGLDAIHARLRAGLGVVGGQGGGAS